MLSRRNVSRIVAAISAAILAFHTATAALSPEDESFCRRASGAMCRVLGIEDSMPPGETRVAVSDHVFCELADLFFRFKPLVSTAAAKPRTAAPSPVRAAPADGFAAEDRRMLRQIYRAAVFGETPTDAQAAGDVRRRQVLYGTSLYSPPTKYDRGVSSYRAATMAINAPQFLGVKGAYSLSEKDSLARAIRREHDHPSQVFGT